MNDQEPKEEKNTSLTETGKLSSENSSYNSSLEEYFEGSNASSLEKLKNFIN